MIGALFIAAQLAVVARAPEAASTCDAIEIAVAVTSPANAAPVIVAPSLAPFDVLRSSGVPRISREKGQTISEYRYIITTDQVGTFAIPAFEARLGSSVARSRPVAIAVRGATTRGVPTVVARARVDTSLRVNFRSVTTPETVYVGQQANYEVAVFLNETVRDRLRRNPTFFPPDMQSMLAYDLPTHGDPPRRQVGSHCFDALVYQRALFPLMPGRFAIPPAQLVYSLPFSSSFFSHEETHEMQTDSTVVVVVEPPRQGRPADYGGAVGNLRISARLDTTGSRVGDPIRLTVRVSGTGNVKLFPRPSVGVPWGSLVKGDERVRVDSTARKIAGSKEFDWVLTPKIAGELDLPPIRYTYFNPDTRRYEVASSDPGRIRVSQGSLASGDTAKTETLLSLRARYRGVPGAPIHEHPVFWAVIALLPVPALTLRGRDLRRARAARAATKADRLTELATANAVHDPGEVRRAFSSALAERLQLGADSFAQPGALARSLRRRGVSSDLAREVERFVIRLDEAAYSSSRVPPVDAARHAARLYEKVDADALSIRDIIARTSATVMLLVVFAAGAVHAADALAARESFDRGVSAYERRDFVAAREAFIDAVASDPAAPDAWADLGTASWAVADTARTIAAWQRALRMEPLASDLRDRVELVHALPWSAAGYVPPMPASWLFNIAAMIWLVSWAIATRRAYQGKSLGGRRFASAGVASVLLAIGGFALAERLSGRHLAVLRQTASLSDAPQLGGERTATGVIGEVVRVTGRQGAWSRVQLDDGRDGWIENTEIVALDERDVHRD